MRSLEAVPARLPQLCLPLPLKPYRPQLHLSGGSREARLAAAMEQKE